MWDRIKLITGQIWAFIAPTVKMLLTAAGKAAIASATTAVRVAAVQETLSGKEKFAFAFDMVQKDLQAQGLSLLTRHLNKVIELAYEKFIDDGE